MSLIRNYRVAGFAALGLLLATGGCAHWREPTPCSFCGRPACYGCKHAPDPGTAGYHCTNWTPLIDPCPPYGPPGFPAHGAGAAYTETLLWDEGVDPQRGREPARAPQDLPRIPPPPVDVEPPNEAGPPRQGRSSSPRPGTEAISPAVYSKSLEAGSPSMERLRRRSLSEALLLPLSASSEASQSNWLTTGP